MDKIIQIESHAGALIGLDSAGNVHVLQADGSWKSISEFIASRSADAAVTPAASNVPAE